MPHKDLEYTTRIIEKDIRLQGILQFSQTGSDMSRENNIGSYY
jgi:hypothetical protein